ncbi:MAG: ISL3 family transposase [Moorea sp. SIO3C2]|nr:ISL3 family transposase [Moorena sp. SIO3C2]
MISLLTELLNIEGVKVTGYRNDDDFIAIEICSLTREATCPHCGHVSRNVHQNHYHLAQDLPISGQDVFIRYNRRQFKCKTCRKPFSESLSYIGERRQYTDRLAEKVVKELVHGDIVNVAKHNHTTADVVESMLDYMSKKKWNLDLSSLTRVGLDEIALRKGHKNYVVSIVDLDRNEVIGLVEGRTHEAINKELDNWDKEVLGQIKEVSIDLTGNYRSLVEKRMPNAEIVADRFHVSKIINDELNDARILEKKELKNIKNKKERARLSDILKGSKYALLKPEENLTEKQKSKLKEVKDAFPLLAKMHQQREDFRDIFDDHHDWAEGSFALIDWMKEAKDTFKNSIGTLNRWFSEITAYFETRTTSGAVEGLNNRLKLIKRLGYGFRNFENFRLRCLICWHLDFD